MSSNSEGLRLQPEVGQKLRVMQVIDSLDIGGAERVAVNVANLLPRERFRCYLCATRLDGPLAAQIDPDVTTFYLRRTRRYDLGALWRLARYAARERIDLFHAHGSSLFLARAAALFLRRTAVLWHDHDGLGASGIRSVPLYRMATRGAGVIAVNRTLFEWSRRELGIPEHRLWYVPNWVEPLDPAAEPATLPGAEGRRVVCVANLRAQKDHITLLRALARVKTTVPDVHLLLAGKPSEPHYLQFISTQIGLLNLAANVTCLGPREDVESILRASDIGVLSSASEGLPLALLEYARAGLPVVATDVGQCAEVLDRGRVGFLVPRSSPEPMADAIIQLLASPTLRADRGAALQQHVARHFSSEAALGKLERIYSDLLD